MFESPICLLHYSFIYLLQYLLICLFILLVLQPPVHVHIAIKDYKIPKNRMYSFLEADS